MKHKSHTNQSTEVAAIAYWIDSHLSKSERPEDPRTPNGKYPKPLCNVHKTYQAIRKPRCECKECWNAYNKKNKNG